MSIEQTRTKLSEMKLHGMAKSFASQLSSATAQGLALEDRFGMIVDDEITDRENRRLQPLLRGAKLKMNAHLEALDRSAKRKLDSELITNLGSCQWVERGINLVISGKCGTGKSWLSCALAHRACMHGYSAQYHRLNLLLQDLVQARHDGSFRKRLMLLTRYSLLILDDLGVSGPPRRSGRQHRLARGARLFASTALQVRGQRLAGAGRPQCLPASGPAPEMAACRVLSPGHAAFGLPRW